MGKHERKNRNEMKATSEAIRNDLSISDLKDMFRDERDELIDEE